MKRRKCKVERVGVGYEGIVIIFNVVDDTVEGIGERWDVEGVVEPDTVSGGEGYINGSNPCDWEKGDTVPEHTVASGYGGREHSDGVEEVG